MKKIIAIVILDIIAVLTPLWCWALVGMSNSVGTAWVMTDLILWCCSTVLVILIVEEGDVK